MKKIMGSIIFFSFVLVAHGQEINFNTHSIGFSFEHLYSSKIQVNQEPHFNSNGSPSGNGLFPSKRLLGNMGSIYYKRHLSDQSAVGIEFFGGRANSLFSIRLNEEFLSPPIDVYIDNFLETFIVPLGLTVFYNHKKRLSVNSFIDFSVGLSGVYSISNVGGSEAGILIDGQLHTFYKNKYEANPDNRIIPALYLSVGYNYNITPHFGVHANLLIRHSNSIILNSEEPYQLIGNQEIITGTYYKKFSQFGWRFGFHFNFGQL